MSSNSSATVTGDSHCNNIANSSHESHNNQFKQNKLLSEYKGDRIKEKSNTLRRGLINNNGFSKTKPPTNINISHIETSNMCSPDEANPQHELRHQKLSEYQGDQIEEKQRNVFRIGFININGIPKTHNHPKNKNIEEALIKYNFDYFGFAETNCYWPLAADENKWHERVCTWNFSHSKSILSYYIKPLVPELNQPGGVISMALNYATNRVFASGKDEILGRWSWITLRGKTTSKPPSSLVTGPATILQALIMFIFNISDTCK